MRKCFMLLPFPIRFKHASALKIHGELSLIEVKSGSSS